MLHAPRRSRLSPVRVLALRLALVLLLYATSVSAVAFLLVANGRGTDRFLAVFLDRLRA